MRCQSCPFAVGSDSQALSEEELLEIVECDDCPTVHGSSPPPAVTTRLFAALRSQIDVRLQLQGQLKKARNEVRELRELAQLSEERVIKLEELQKVSTREADAELRAKMELLTRQQAEIMALSTPVIQVEDGVLVLPLIGVVDEQRAATLTESLLAEITRTRARHAILDLTGVPSLDRSSARSFLSIAQAVRLLGANVVLCGLRTESAKVLAGLQMDLSALRTMRSLQDALRYCIALNKR